tara:strand:- start:299 stop:499 length:201 start_codon:yes stop_codon:yes gene_type:complete
MSNIKTITEMIWSGSNDAAFQAVSGSLTQEREDIEGESQLAYIPTIQLLQKKIDELVEEVNILKNQ